MKGCVADRLTCMNAKRAVIYVRVSSDQNRGRSVQDQERECRALCADNGWTVRDVYRDNDIGASRFSGKERPGWEKLKSELQSGDILAVWEASRATRDMDEFMKLRVLGVGLGLTLAYSSGDVIDMSTPEGRKRATNDAVDSEYETERLSARVLRGKRTSAAEGRPYGRPPWGLRRADTAEVKWELDPVEAPRLRESMDRVLEGKSLRSVLLWLQSSGYAPTGVTGLRRGLCNPAVAGLRVHQARAGKTETFKAEWDPIVTPDEQARLNAHAKRNAEPRGKEPIHLLSGIAVCGVCDAGLQHKRREGRRDNYRCPNGHVMRDVAMVDGLALAELVKGFAGETPPADDAVARAAKAAIVKIEDRLARYEELAINGEISGGAFARMEQKWLAQIAELRLKTVQAIPDPYEYMRISTEEFMAAAVPERRSMMRARLNVKVNPVPAGRRARAEDTVITRR